MSGTRIGYKKKTLKIFINKGGNKLKIIATSIFVDDQEKAKQFYTEKLGFELVHDMEIGGGFKWLTVKENNSDNPVEIVLEPNENPIAKHIKTIYLMQVFLSQCLAFLI